MYDSTFERIHERIRSFSPGDRFLFYVLMIFVSIASLSNLYTGAIALGASASVWRKSNRRRNWESAIHNRSLQSATQTETFPVSPMTGLWVYLGTDLS